MWRATLWALLACAGCNQIFGLGQTAVVDGAIGGTCSTTQPCATPSVCDQDQHTCVQCTAGDHAACIGGSPVCGSDDACHACGSNSECPSQVCNVDGSCGDESAIVYVSSTGVDPPGLGSGSATVSDPTLCTRTAPCATLSKALFVQRGTASLYKVSGSISDSVTIPGGRTVEIVGDPDSEIHAGSAAFDVRILDNAVVTMRELAITSGKPGISLPVGENGNTATVHIIHCDLRGNTGLGMDVVGNAPPDAEPTVTIARSMISHNSGGGVSISNAAFQLVGNLFVSNGTATSNVGGLFVTSQATGNRLDFNTFVDNHANVGIPGFACHAPVSASFVATNDVAAGNVLTGNASSPQVQDDDGCKYAFTVALQTIAPKGTNTFAADPVFADPAMGDFHVLMNSPAYQGADPDADLTGQAGSDEEGTERAKPADIGGLQHKPN